MALARRGAARRLARLVPTPTPLPDLAATPSSDDDAVRGVWRRGRGAGGARRTPDARPLLPSQPPVAGRRLLGADGAEHEVTIMEDPLDLSNEMPDDYR